MFKFKKSGPTSGDCTAPYDIILEKTYTVEEFVNTVLTNRDNEWGYIGIKNKNEPFFGYPCCEYKRGHLLSVLPADILAKKIQSVTASGGWSRMDYKLILAEE